MAKLITAAKDFALLLSTLRAGFPLSKPMWQVVRDTRDGLMEANIFTDDWPDYTTVVSQEFAPKLSQVADIRVHSKKADKVMQVIDAAKLLETMGNWQGIFFLNTISKDNLVSAVSQHHVVKERSLSLDFMEFQFGHLPEDRELNFPPPPGYLVKSLLPEHAELAADEEIIRGERRWYSDYTTYHQRMEYFKEMIERFGGVGAYEVSNSSKPVAWTLRKNGGIHGLSFTLPEHRGRNLIAAISSELASRAREKDEVIVVETTRPSSKLYEICGGAAICRIFLQSKDK